MSERVNRFGGNQRRLVTHVNLPANQEAGVVYPRGSWRLLTEHGQPNSSHEPGGAA